MNILNLFSNKSSPITTGVIDYGKNKKGGSHDHRTNRGDDRTQAQKEGDKKHGKHGK